MLYKDLRQSHYEASGAKVLNRHTRKADRVHAALTLVAAENGPKFMASMSKSMMKAAVKKKMGVTILAPILMMLFELLLPILIKWLTDSLTAKTYGSSAQFGNLLKSFTADAEAAL